jgi:hypothetical protein
MVTSSRGIACLTWQDGEGRLRVYWSRGGAFSADSFNELGAVAGPNGSAVSLRQLVSVDAVHAPCKEDIGLWIRFL